VAREPGRARLATFVVLIAETRCLTNRRRPTILVDSRCILLGQMFHSVKVSRMLSLPQMSAAASTKEVRTRGIEENMTKQPQESGTPLVELPVVRSRACFERARLSVAGGVSSNVRLAGPQPPLVFDRASGSHLFDVDGNRYIDFALGMGPTILGHAPQAVLASVQESLAKGQLFAGSPVQEHLLAEAIQLHVSGAELIRFGLSGSEMVQAALRVARASTGRSRVIKFEGHYHGWFDNVLINHVHGPSERVIDGSFPVVLETAGQPRSATAEAVVLPWNDLHMLDAYLAKHGHEIAAIIMEPVMCNTGVILPLPGYLQGVRELCDRHGIVLIFDEVITGFRLCIGGAQQLFDVRADLTVYAKAIGAGFPLAVLAGKASIMGLIGAGTVNHSGTYNSNTLSIAAGLATIEALSANGGKAYNDISVRGAALIAGLQSLAERYGIPLRVQGYPAVFSTFFSSHSSVSTYAEFKSSDARQLARFIEGLQTNGVRPTSRGTWFVSSAHSEADVEAALLAAEKALQLLPGVMS
jgi:glutamate-1-semialdehyde 2,1-aminomutase